LQSTRHRAIELLLRRRWVVLAALLALTAALGIGLPALRFDFSPGAMLRTGSSDDRFFSELNRTFDRDSAQLMVVVRRPGGVLRRDVLEYVDRLVAGLRRAAWVEEASGITTVRVPRSRGDELHVTPLGVELGEETIRGNRLVDGRYINAKRDATVVFIRLRDGAAVNRDVRRLRRLTDALGRALRTARIPAGTEPRVYGIPALRVEAVEVMKRDQRLLVPMVALFAVVLLVLFGGRPVAAVAPLFMVAVALVWTIGAMGHLGLPFNMVTNILPILLFTIAISDSVHLLARYREELGRDPQPDRGALHRATAAMATACFATSLTTAMGFASLGVSRTAVLSTFGWIAAAGVMVAYVTTILGLPALLSAVRPLRAVSPPTTRLPLSRALEGAASLAVRRPLACLIGAAALIALTIPPATTVEKNFRLRGGLDPDSELYRSQMQSERDAGGLVHLTISVRAAGRDGLRRAEVIRRVWALQRFIEAQPGAGQTLSPADVVRELMAATVGRRGVPDLPRTDEQLAQLLLIASFGDDAGWDRLVTSDWSHLRILARFRDEGSKQHEAVFARVEARARALLAGLPGVTEVRLSGQGYLAVKTMHYFIEDLLWSLLTAALVIFVSIGLVLRSARAGLISVVPNLLPMAVGFAYMALRGIPLNGFTIVAFPVTLGFVVDSTIHVLVRFREERRRLPVDDAIRRTVISVGRPAVGTSLLMVLGFSVAMFGNFRATQWFAELLTAGVVSALVGDLLLLPALLKALARSTPTGAR